MSTEKQFFTYKGQIEELQNKGIICSEDDIHLLVKHGYFNLVNGYREPFFNGKDQNGNRLYLAGTSLQQISLVKEFDDQLRTLLLKSISHVEEELRTISAYCFDYYNTKGETPWHDKNAYRAGCDRQDYSKVVTAIYKDLIYSQSDYVQYYWSQYADFPGWIVFKNINLSTFINIMKLAKDDVNYAICDLYGIANAAGKDRYKILLGSLHWLRIVRNNCAHNERVYCLRPQGGKAASLRIVEQYFSQMKKSYRATNTPKCIMDLLVYLKYYYSSEEFDQLNNQIKELLYNLKGVILPDAFEKVRADMGIKDLADLDTLAGLSKKPIDYASLANMLF